MQYLQNQSYPFPIEHIVFLDGYSSQFKCGRFFFYVARYPSLTNSEELPLRTCMQWNYFGSGHGKGRWDGIGASIKQVLRSEQVKPNGVQLHNVKDVVKFLQRHFNQKHAGYTQVRRDVHCLFYEIKLVDVNREQQFNAHTVAGMRSLHQVCNVGLNKISMHI
jgi:hypothetical protein